MQSFFHRCRQKMGVVTLVMACISLAAWIRTLVMMDALKLDIDVLSPFSSITISLTAISTYLLLSKPRTASAQTTTLPETERNA